MMFGGEAYADTFGDLNMWETIKIQMMVSAGAQLTEQVRICCVVLARVESAPRVDLCCAQMVQERLQQFAMERHAKLVKALIMKLEPFVISDLERFKKNVEADVADKVRPNGTRTCTHAHARLALRTRTHAWTGEITAAQDLIIRSLFFGFPLLHCPWC